MTAIRIDATGLTCPLPFFKLRRILRTLEPGTRVEVLSTDPLAPDDFRELCEALGHQFIGTHRNGVVECTLIEVNIVTPK